MGSDTPQLRYRALRLLMVSAVMIGLATLAVLLFLLGVFRDFNLGWAALSAGVGAAVWGGVFFLGSLVVAPGLGQYITNEDTRVKGPVVELVTETRQSGDPHLDGWVRAYVSARNVFGLSAVPLLILAGLFFLA